MNTHRQGLFVPFLREAIYEIPLFVVKASIENDIHKH